MHTRYTVGYTAGIFGSRNTRSNILLRHGILGAIDPKWEDKRREYTNKEINDESYRVAVYLFFNILVAFQRDTLLESIIYHFDKTISRTLELFKTAIYDMNNLLLLENFVSPSHFFTDLKIADKAEFDE